MRRSLRLAIGALAVAGGALSMSVSPSHGAAQGTGVGHVDRVDHLTPVGVVNLAQIAAQPAAAPANLHHLSIVHPFDEAGHVNASPLAIPQLLGGATAPTSSVVTGGDNGNFNGISIIDQKGAGTGSYANTGLTLEPPDQGLCTGNGFVMEEVNLALRVYTTAGAPVTPPISMNQFFNRAAGGTSGPTDFMSDPRCYFDYATQRWFVTILDLTSSPAYPSFAADHNFIAVSQTSNPTGSWTIYGFDVTDNGMNGSPVHAGCVSSVIGAGAGAGCLGDQPTIGADQYGIYITDNEYAFAEVFPVAPPVGPPLQQVPVLRSGVAQMYALSKLQLVTGSSTTLVRFDSSTVPFPGAPVPSEDAPWQSISPAQPVYGDTTPATANGTEYFMSDVGLPVGHNANQIVVWSWTNTASLQTASPSLTLQNVTINTAAAGDTFFVPDPSPSTSGPGLPFDAYQKDGPHPQAAAAGDPEEYLNANDDRMSWVKLSGGFLWSALNTQLPPSNPSGTGHSAENRVGIMYFKVQPSIDSAGTLSASTALDGYVTVANNNVLFPSIGPRIDGATVVTFTLAGIDYYPSVAWARLDNVTPGQGPDVHVARLGQQPEDGFTGLGLSGQQGLTDNPPCGPCVTRWGDYSATQVAADGCIWGSAEYIPTAGTAGYSDTNPLAGFPGGPPAGTPYGGNWGTGVYSVCPATVTPPIAEAPFALALPSLGLAGAAAVLAGRRRRRRRAPVG